MMKNKSPKEKYTIEFIENKIETKLTYPFQFFKKMFKM